MSHDNENVNAKPSGPIQFLFENSMFLILGTVGALVWANLGPDSYHRFANFDFSQMVRPSDDRDDASAHDAASEDHGDSSADHGADGAGHGSGEGHHGLTLHFVVNDILMALFFAIAAKEVWEAMLPGGVLADRRKAATPLLATAGGVIGPAGLFLAALGVCHLAGVANWNELTSGWAVPCATDIAFSYLVARLIFGPSHPAITFLLLLAIADDAVGLIILAVAYPQAPLAPLWLLLCAAAILLALCFHRVLKLESFWWYLLIPGVMSWFSFYMTGIHAALGLIPIIPCLPHAKSELGMFLDQQKGQKDTLNQFEHWWENPVELILGLFGLVNAGVAFSSFGVGTWLVLLGLIIGKPLGITLFTWMGDKLLGLQIPEGMNYRHVVTLGCIAGIGFTVALFVATAAFPVPPTSQATLDAVKMGALGSFFAGLLAFIVARALGIRPVKPVKKVASAPGHDLGMSAATTDDSSHSGGRGRGDGGAADDTSDSTWSDDTSPDHIE